MKRIFSVFLSVSLLVFIVAEVNARGRGGGGHHERSHARSSINSDHHSNRGNAYRNNGNRNVNINSNRNVNVDVNNRGYHHGCCYHDDYHPFAVAAAVTATALVVGSIVHSLPPSCQTVMSNGFAYQQCGNTWYQPQISGSSTTYIVVNAP